MSGTSELRRPRTRLVGALVALAVLVGGASLLTPDVTAVESAPVTEPVASTELVCPVTTATTALTSTVTAGVAPLPTVKDGIATLADLSVKETSEPLRITKPGQTVSRVIEGKSGPAMLARATGSFAQGLGADQAIRSGQGATRGLAASPCARPVTDAWLVGGGSTVGRLTQVLLVNDDDRPAQVDLLVYGEAGPVPAPGASGIELPAGSRKQVRLDTLAPNQALVAVHAIARSGRIGLVGLDQEAVGLVPMGMALIPPTEAGTRLVIPGIPAPVHYAALELLSPEVDTTVSLTLLTADGQVTPAGISSVNLEAGKVLAVNLNEALAGAPAGVVIRSEAEVVAGVEVGTGDTATLREKDATAPVPALTAPGVVVGLAGGALKHAVMLSAPGKAAKVSLALYAPGASAPVWRRTITVESGSLARVTIPVTTPTASSTLVLTPLSGGPVYASRQVTEAGRRGPMIALAPILPQRASTLVPTVVSKPGSSVPGVSSR
ncbi:MAG: DUF5719 family protein [Candidatus Nanopelagicales bacterium]